MTARALLLVFGARALNDTDAAREWATTIIDVWIRAMPYGATLLSGGCLDSPDAWAAETVLSDRSDMKLLEFRLDGHRWLNGQKTDITWLDLTPVGAEEDRGTARWPLRRNDALAEAVLRARRRGWLVWSLGLRAAWSKTKGTEYMIGKLEKTPWSVMLCPSNYGPKS